MNNQKDTQNTDINSYGHNDVSSRTALANKPIYEFANKKTEKLVTALYMVTDCMDTDDALKGKLRFLGVELLSDMYKISTLTPIEKKAYITTSLIHINELLSFIGIASTIGFISEMNSTILHREFNNLIEELQSYQSKDTHFTFSLNDSMFEVEKPKADPYILKDNIKDNHNGHTFKRTYENSNLHKIPSPLSSTKGLRHNTFNIADKQERSQKILSLIKGKKDSSGHQPGISIKDISIAFTDCSEKTIQRELNTLVSKGAIKKIGAKRWSRYQAI